MFDEQSQSAGEETEAQIHEGKGRKLHLLFHKVASFLNTETLWQHIPTSPAATVKAPYIGKITGCAVYTLESPQ